MSRIGKKPIKIPHGVSFTLSNGAVEVTGPKGKMSKSFHERVIIQEDDGHLKVLPQEGIETSGAYWGLYRTLLANMVEGVSNGFQRQLEIQGTGYRASMAGVRLQLNVGFSHNVSLDPPEGVKFEVDKTGKITVSGLDKELVGQSAAKIRAIRPVEPYKGKGIRYSGEIVKTKVGKSTGKK